MDSRMEHKSSKYSGSIMIGPTVEGYYQEAQTLSTRQKQTKKPNNKAKQKTQQHERLFFFKTRVQKPLPLISP